jgi:hypothetical protein
MLTQVNSQAGSSGDHSGKRPPRVSDTVKGAIVGALGTILATALTVFFGHTAGVVYIGTLPSPSQVPTTSLPDSATNPPSSATGSTSPPLPTGVSVRRSTGSVPIKLTDGYGVDLDDNVSPNWLAHSGPAGSGAGGGSDVDYGSDSTTGLDFSQDAAVEQDAAGYATCAEETAYSHNSIPEGDLQKDMQAHDKICVRTDQNRYALLTIISVSPTEVEFAVTTWDPPFATS